MEESKESILGSKAKDTITGFTGIAIGKAVYLHGLPSIGITSQELHDGKPISTEWFSEEQVEFIE